MRTLIVLAAVAVLGVPVPATSQDPDHDHDRNDADLKEWNVAWEGRPRDPYMAPDGKVWFVGQAGNYIGYFDPQSESFERYEIEEGTHPHNVIVDEEGIVWYAGHRNGRIGRLDPGTGEIETIMTGEANPHTQMFDGRGNIWFTSQNGIVGRLNKETREVDLIWTAGPSERTGPYGIDVDEEGRPWVSLFAGNMLATVDPETLDVEIVETPEGGRVRRNTITPDGTVWYVDFTRGYLGKVDPETREIREWAMPGGEDSRPYAINSDDEGRLWISETGERKRIVGFDPQAEEFFTIIPVSNTVRHMMFHEESGTLWFGTDSHNIGRIVTRTFLP